MLDEPNDYISGTSQILLFKANNPPTGGFDIFYRGPLLTMILIMGALRGFERSQRFTIGESTYLGLSI